MAASPRLSALLYFEKTHSAILVRADANSDPKALCSLVQLRLMVGRTFFVAMTTCT